MSATRRFVKEALELAVSDSIGTHDIPDSRAPSEDERFVDLDIDTQVNTINTLVDKLSSYHQLVSEFPPGSVLTPSEERLFTAAVNMSFAGEGLTAKDVRMVLESECGFVISTEGVGSVLTGIGRAIADAINALIEKVKAFFRWITGSKTKEEREAEEIRKALDGMSGDIEAALEQSIKELEKGIKDYSKSVDDEQHAANRVIKTLSQGAVLEGEFLVVNSKTVSNPNGKVTRIDVSKMIDLPWARINRLFPEPPQSKRIDLMEASRYINVAIDEASNAFPQILKEIGALDKEVDRLLKGKQTKPSLMDGDMKRLAERFKEIRQSVMRVYGFKPQEHEAGTLVSNAIFPDGTTLSLSSSARTFAHGTSWAQYFEGDSTPFHLRIHSAVPHDHTETFSIHVGAPKALAATIDGVMKRYFNAFHRVEEVTNELRLLTRAVDLDSLSVSTDLKLNNMDPAPAQGEDDVSKMRHASHAYQHDLLMLKSCTVSSYGVCYQALANLTAMLSQYKKLYSWLPQ